MSDQQTKFSLSALDECDLKFASDGEGSFEGYLSVFGSVDTYGDTVMKGAYTETLKDRKRFPPMLLNHDVRSVPIGKWTDMREDNSGLRVKGELTKGNPQSEQVYASMKHGAMGGLSIGYKAVEFEKNEHGGLNLLKIDLFEGSVVSIPAEDAARIDVVKYGDQVIQTITDIKSLELVLKKHGLTRDQARRVANHGFSALNKPNNQTALAKAMIARAKNWRTQNGSR